MKPADQTKNKSPFEPGSCECGFPNCQGHEPDADGKVHIPNHPRGHLVLDMSKWASN